MTGAAVTPRHHPSEATLAQYVAGTLRPGFDVVVAAHLSTCAHCRAEAARLEAVGAAMLDEQAPVDMSADALDRALARIETPEAEVPPAPTLAEVLTPRRRRWLAPGVWTAKVDTPRYASDRVYLLGVGPGISTADHGHGGLEFTQVISGALQDGDIVYRAGDFIEHDADHEHQPVVWGDEPCVCLFATQGRLKPKGWLGRLVFALADV
ncbi:ChrR family anti-sigma-E factor [Brevundimonas sp. 2R-24]|uniref:ChrR family anti-sigma-E factor n=1 Tax=Peiella sedimenti TaxID=3061083 RepID=A0ABT8SJS1_9CAUL|nr:ChrR family anti-sigma-E factor [Caulobacteraceae bacterium XZ-24]